MAAQRNAKQRDIDRLAAEYADKQTGYDRSPKSGWQGYFKQRRRELAATKLQSFTS